MNNNVKVADMSPEELAAYRVSNAERMRKWRESNREHYRATMKAYNAQPEVKEKRKLIDSRPIHKERRKSYSRRDDVRAVAKKRSDDLWKNAEYRAAKVAYGRYKYTGFSPELYAMVMESQGNACALCRVSFSVKKAHADHCHDTKAPRGILCCKCNILEGQLRAFPFTPREFVDRLEHYLSNSPVSLLSVR